MRYALMIALALVACRKTEERKREPTTGTRPSEPSTEPSTEPSGAARTTTTPQRGDRTAEAMRPDRMNPKAVAMRVADAKWAPGPPALPKGAQIMVLEGVPPFKTEDMFTLLVKFPKNYTIPPHTHLVTERVTVLQGALSFGHGEKLDRAAATKLTVGGLALIPRDHVHYAFTTDQETTIALTGVGPWEIIYVNPKDDPRPTPVRKPDQMPSGKWEAPVDAKLIQASDVRFEDPPAGLLPSGVKMAVLEGDPKQAKTFTVRLQFPKGSRMPVHSHSHSERAFVVSGGGRFAFGDTWDDSKLKAATAPAVDITPPDITHYAQVDEDTVVQIFGVGPMDVKWANPADVPRSEAPR